MSGEQTKSPGVRAAQPGRESRENHAASMFKVARCKAVGQPGSEYTVSTEDGGLFAITVAGRNAWALDRLIRAGTRGVTPIDEPAGPRWSAYIYNLRALGVPIETVTENHGGPFPGKHGRYILRAVVRKGGAA